MPLKPIDKLNRDHIDPYDITFSLYILTISDPYGRRAPIWSKMDYGGVMWSAQLYDIYLINLFITFRL